MKWILQENSFSYEEYDKFIFALKKYNVDYQTVKVSPFSLDMEPELKFAEGEKVIVFGTIFLSKIAQERGWIVYHNDNFDQRIWAEKYKGFVLNEDVEYYKIKDMPEDLKGEVFIRPVLDWKLFTGHRRVGKKIKGWKKSFVGDKWDSDVIWKDAPEQWVSVTSPKTIIDEMRFAVVDGKVVTGSTYRVAKRTMMGKLDRPLNDPLYEWIQGVVDIWQPDRAFMIDVAVTKEGDRKVVEVNTINASGVYDMDVEAIVKAIQEMEG